MSRFTSAKTITRVTEQISIADKLGYDARQAKDTIARATGLIKSNDSVSALDMATIAEKEIENILVSGVTFAITDAQHQLNEAKIIPNATDAKKYLDNARDALDGKKYEDAVNYANRAKSTISKVVEATEKIMGPLSNEFKDLETKIKDAEALQIGIPATKELYSQATKALEAKNYELASELLNKTSKMLVSDMLAQYKNVQQKHSTRSRK
jgi:phage shock protein A